MLAQLAVDGIDLDIEAKGDLEIDGDHTVEDVGWASVRPCGKPSAIVADRLGLGHDVLLDEVLTRVVIDLLGGCISWTRT